MPLYIFFISVFSCYIQIKYIVLHFCHVKAIAMHFSFNFHIHIKYIDNNVLM